MSPILRLKSMKRQMYDYVNAWRSKYGHAPSSVIIGKTDYLALFEELKTEPNVRLPQALASHSTFMGVYIDVRDDEELAKLENPT